MWFVGWGGYEISYVSWRLGGVHGVNAVIQPEDGYCWKAETCSCTLGSNVNTPLPSNKQVVLD